MIFINKVRPFVLLIAIFVIWFYSNSTLSGGIFSTLFSNQDQLNTNPLSQLPPHTRQHPLQNNLPYRPQLWSQPRNNLANCYGYIRNIARCLDPGQDTGMDAIEDYQTTPESILARSISDGLSPTPIPNSYLVYFVVSYNDDFDYHWYRQDDSGLWSHKLRKYEPVTNLDAAGNLIHNPVTADHNYPVPYHYNIRGVFLWVPWSLSQEPVQKKSYPPSKYQRSF